jgi:hypothetical protein
VVDDEEMADVARAVLYETMRDSDAKMSDRLTAAKAYVTFGPRRPADGDRSAPEDVTSFYVRETLLRLARELEADGLIRNARFVTEEGRTFLAHEPLDVEQSLRDFVDALWRDGARAAPGSPLARDEREALYPEPPRRSIRVVEHVVRLRRARAHRARSSWRPRASRRNRWLSERGRCAGRACASAQGRDAQHQRDFAAAVVRLAASPAERSFFHRFGPVHLAHRGFVQAGRNGPQLARNC